MHFDGETWKKFRDKITVLDSEQILVESQDYIFVCDIKHSILCTEEIAWTYSICCCSVVFCRNKVLIAAQKKKKKTRDSL